METDIRDQFEQFLIENDCFSQFCTNLLEQKHLTFEEYVEKHIIEYEHRYMEDIDRVNFWNWLLLDAFWYPLTSQGEEYWMSIYYRWKKNY